MDQNMNKEEAKRDHMKPKQGQEQRGSRKRDVLILLSLRETQRERERGTREREREVLINSSKLSPAVHCSTATKILKGSF